MEEKELAVNFKADLGTISTEMIPAIEAYAKVIAEPYKTAIVTEDGIKDAKKDRANLKKVKDAIDSERKRIKGIWNDPLKTFETELKKAIAPIDDAIVNIDSQVKRFEEEQWNIRFKDITESIKKDASDMSKALAAYILTPVVWYRVYKEAYTNKTYSRTKAENEWRAALRQIMIDLESIGDDEMLKSAYTRVGNLGQAQNEVKAERERIAEIEKLKTKEDPAPHQSEVHIQELVKEEVTERVTEEVTENPFTTDGKDVKIFTSAEPTLLSPDDMKIVKATRSFGGEKWKILRLFEFAEALRLDVIK